VITPELRYLTAKMAALLPFRKAADFLGEFLPLSARATASTVRNRTMKVGRRLQKSAEALATAASNEPCKELIVGFDGGYVRNRHQRPERNFEVIAGKALDRDGHATRFAFVRNGGSIAVTAIGLALQHCGGPVCSDRFFGFLSGIIARRNRGGGNVKISFIDFQGLWEGRETALSFSALSTDRHFHGRLRCALCRPC
jgi:hypothetical protein